MGQNSKKIRKMEYIGDDFWSRPVYKDQFGKLWKDLNCGDSETPDLYWPVNNEFDEEPYLPIGCEFVIVKAKEKNGKEFQYMMLDRLRTDCDYYLGYGNRYAGVLAKGDEKEQIEAMKKLWLEFDEDKKPEWLTWAQILEYEKQMCNR